MLSSGGSVTDDDGAGAENTKISGIIQKMSGSIQGFSPDGQPIIKVYQYLPENNC